VELPGSNPHAVSGRKFVIASKIMNTASLRFMGSSFCGQARPLHETTVLLDHRGGELIS
jgi:hypothetical protein